MLQFAELLGLSSIRHDELAAVARKDIPFQAMEQIYSTVIV
jgi:hypothetical protein